MKTSMKLLATLAAVSILAGCQTMGGKANVVSGSAMPVAPFEKTLKITSQCKDNTFRTHALTYELEAKSNCANEASKFGQRNQYRTNFDPVPKSPKTVIFESDISFTTESKEQFTLFTVHSKQDWCAPPIAVEVQGYMIKITGAWKYKKPISNTNKPWNDYCKKDVVERELKWVDKDYIVDGAVQYEFKRDGTPQKVRFEVHHDGKGNIYAELFIDGEKIVEGFYGAPDTSIYREDKVMSHMFGVYSEKYWDYKMKFDNVVFKEVR